MTALRPIDRWFIDEVLPHEARFLRVARRLERDIDAANDLVQEAYVRLYAMDGWASIASPSHYVLRMVRNMSIERLRRSKIIAFQRISDIDESNFVDDAPCQFRVAAGKELVARIGEALAAMPERCRTVLVRRRFDNQPPREIARELGISLSTMEKRLARAVVLLARALGPEGSGALVLDEPEEDTAYRDDATNG